MRPATKRVLAALVTAAVLGTGLSATASGQPAGPQQERGADVPATYRHLRARIYRAPGLGTIAVGAPNPRRFMLQRLDEASGTWSAPRLLVRSTGRVTCGDISGRASAGGIALLLQCDTPYYEDQAPASSIALVTRDLRTWSKKVLPGEAYRAPAIAPDGSYAAWLAGGIGSFVQWSSSTGFSRLRSATFSSDAGSATLVVTNDGTVSVIGAESSGEGCVIAVHELTLTGRRSSSQVEGVDPGCVESNLENRGAFEVVNSTGDRASRFVIRREDDASPWRLTRRAPDTAPGLIDYKGTPRRVIYSSYSDVVGQPLVAYGSPDRQRIFVQGYDQAAQVWGPRALVYDHGFPGCASRGTLLVRRMKVHAVSLHCYPVERADDTYPPFTEDYLAAPVRRVRTLLSSDGVDWRTVNVAGRPVGLSPDRTLVTAPGATSTVVLSTDGFTVLPVRARARCGFVLAVAPDRVLRLHGGQGARWPRLLQRHDGTRWRTIQKVRLPRDGTCARVRSLDYTSPTTYALDGAGKQVLLRVVRRTGGWRVVRATGY